MRRVVLAGLAALVLACGQPVAAARPAVGAPAPVQARTEPQLFALDKGFTFPLRNGARVAIENGWIEPRFSPFPPGKDVDLDVAVIAASPAAGAAEVTVSYDMVEMGHGATTVHAGADGAGHHRAHVPMGMYGTWLITVKVVLDGVTSTAVLMLAGTGL